ncbi:MAG: bifunctional DNA primase/polymerase, partial [Acidimicrobiia bacterium]
MMPTPVVGQIGELKGHALAYAAAGFAVFPLHGDKTPRTTNGMKDATTDPAAVTGWWDRWPDALIGCRVPEDVVVIDVDPKHNGMATWKALKHEHGELPHTRGHHSGRNDGGGHLWFRRPHGKLSIRNLNRWAKEHGTGEAAGKHSWVAGIDLLHHNHRYTILPPSPHPVTGAPYQWVKGHGPE